MTSHLFEKFKFEAGKIFNNQDLMFRSLEMLKQIIMAKLSLFDTHRQGTMERKTRYEVQELLVAE